MIVNVPKGEHELKVSIEGASSVLLRILVSEGAGREERTVGLTPVEAATSDEPVSQAVVPPTSGGGVTHAQQKRERRRQRRRTT